nr:MAG TPA: eIF3 subunit M, C-terminal helix [Caudoviricetes sp.]
MDQQTITSLMSLLAIFVSFYTAYNVKNIEREKSKLKKVEILFNMQVEAVKEFNKIYHELSPLNLGDVRNGEFYGKTQWEQIRSRISKYQADYAFLFEDDEIIRKLEDIMISLDFITQEYAYYEEKDPGMARDIEVDKYIDTLKLIAESNGLIKRYMFKELNNN